MGKDFKIGLVCGLVLAVIALVWVASRPSLRPEARMARAAQAGSRDRPLSAHPVPMSDNTAGSGPSARPAPPLSDPDPIPSAQIVGNGSAQQTPLSEPVSPRMSAAEQPVVQDMTI